MLLNTLLFSKPTSPDSTTSSSPRASAQQADSSSSGGSTASQGSGRCPAGCWSSVWPCAANSFRADLSAFKVPTDGQSGLEFQVRSTAKAATACILQLCMRVVKPAPSVVQDLRQCAAASWHLKHTPWVHSLSTGPDFCVVTVAAGIVMAVPMRTRCQLAGDHVCLGCRFGNLVHCHLLSLTGHS